MPHFFRLPARSHLPQTDYHIEDIDQQSADLVVYRAQQRDGSPVALIRLRYDDETLALLSAGRFDQALRELQALSHECLRPVLDGGLDPIDSSPWVAVRWWEGAVLSERIKQGPILTQDEFDRIKNHGTALVETLDSIASTISFTTASVVTSSTDSGSLIDTFSIDYHSWFHSFARDIHPASHAAPSRKLAKLLDTLKRYTARTPAALITPRSGPSSHPASSRSAHPRANKSSFPLKSFITACALLIGIGGGAWFDTQRSKSGKMDHKIVAAKANNPPKNIPPPEAHSDGQSLDLEQVKADHPKVEGIESRHSPKEIYSIHDEALLRTMRREVITVDAEALKMTNSKKGQTLYLQLHEKTPQFAIGFELSRLEAELDESFIKSLRGKKMRYTGKVRIDASGDRLSIVVTKKSQIKPAE